MSSAEDTQTPNGEVAFFAFVAAVSVVLPNAATATGSEVALDPDLPELGFNAPVVVLWVVSPALVKRDGDHVFPCELPDLFVGAAPLWDRSAFPVVSYAPHLGTHGDSTSAHSALAPCVDRSFSTTRVPGATTPTSCSRV